MTPEEVWRSKSDEQVADAAQHLDDYTEVGQQIILSEVERRGLLTNEEVGVDERPEETEPQLDEAELQVALDRMRSQQNLPGAVVAGIASAMVGAVVWAAVTVATDYQIGWMAVGVGFIVGVAVREVGKGVDTSFGMVGAVMSALGCATGNVLAICGLIANQQELGILDVVGQLNATAVIALMIATFSPMDLLFYGIAVYEGYRFSFRRISQEDLERAALGRDPRRGRPPTRRRGGGGARPLPRPGRRDVSRQPGRGSLDRRQLPDTGKRGVALARGQRALRGVATWQPGQLAAAHQAGTRLGTATTRPSTLSLGSHPVERRQTGRRSEPALGDELAALCPGMVVGGA